jgi:hypothetical protein
MTAARRTKLVDEIGDDCLHQSFFGGEVIMPSRDIDFRGGGNVPQQWSPDE